MSISQQDWCAAGVHSYRLSQRDGMQRCSCGAVFGMRPRLAPSPPPQPALDVPDALRDCRRTLISATTRLAAEADDLEQRYVAQRERAERAEEACRELEKLLENASKSIAAYQDATGTDYPGSLRAHQRVPDLIKAGRAYREQWGIAEAMDSQMRAERAEAGVAELTRRIEGMERDHAEAVGELLETIRYEKSPSFDVRASGEELVDPVPDLGWA